MHTRLTTWRLAAILIAALAGAAGAQDVRERQARDEPRERWQRVPDVLSVMGARPGAVVADVGAGGGFFTARLARAVGETGRVYAVDISASVIEQLRARVEREGLRNVEVIQGDAADPKLPIGTLDAALIVNSYHEMTDHQAILEKIKSALKPGGRLVIIEPISESRRDDTRDGQTKSHEIGAQYVQDEARQAGFRVVRLEDPFTTREEGSNRDEEWLLVLTPIVPRATTAQDATPRPDGGEEWKSPDLRVAVDDFKQLSARDAVLVLDVRDTESYRRGHLPGAVLMVLTPDTLDARVAELRHETRPIVAYCS